MEQRNYNDTVKDSTLQHGFQIQLNPAHILITYFLMFQYFSIKGAGLAQAV
jgi:hypothetical protein